MPLGLKHGFWLHGVNIRRECWDYLFNGVLESRIRNVTLSSLTIRTFRASQSQMLTQCNQFELLGPVISAALVKLVPLWPTLQPSAKPHLTAELVPLRRSAKPVGARVRGLKNEPLFRLI